MAEMSVINPFDFFLEPSAETFPFVYEPSLRKDLAPFLETLPAGPLLARVLSPAIDRKPVRTIDFSWNSIAACNRRSSISFAWSPACRRPRKHCGLRSGSCRDSAWLLVPGLAASRAWRRGLFPAT